MTRTKFSITDMILLVALALLLGGEVYSGYRLQDLSSERKRIKEDYSLSNNVTFGLFSIDQWSDRISAVVNGEVDDFHLTAEQKKEIQKTVEKQLHSLVSKTVAEINKPQKSIGAKLKKLAFNTLVDSADLQAQVKPFSRTIMAKIASPKSQERLKDIAASKIFQLEKQTYDSTRVANYTVTKYMYKKYNVHDPVSFNRQINEQLAANHKIMWSFLISMLGCVLAALILWWILRKKLHLQNVLFILALVFAFVLLVVGLTTSVIEVDARIKTLHFDLMGGQVAFDNQVLFFQSKSILGIVSTLIGQPKPDAIVVGALIMLFVIVFPMLRLIATGLHVLGFGKVSQWGFVRYLAFEGSKWDMADVMIVGMLMTYIGLNGILKSQLANLNMHSGSLVMETANNTSLQPGYFLFTGYVLFAILLSYILKKTKPEGRPAKRRYRKAE